jgi:hypothetical protein
MGNFTDVKEDVIADIRSQKEEAAFTSWIEALKLKAVIKKKTNISVQKVNQ